MRRGTVRRRRRYFVYILASRSRVLYTGSTSDLQRRVDQHKSFALQGFTRKYNVTRLVYFEEVPSSRSAAERERTLKGWTRRKKIELTEAMNPEWKDLSEAR
jgi:putative endonuclease